MKSFWIYLPTSRTGKIATWFVAVWVTAVLVALVYEIVRPQPTLHVRKDVGAGVAFVLDWQAKQKCLPSPAEFDAWLTRRGLRLNYAIEGDGYSLTGWDGERRWRYSSKDKAFTRAE